MSTMTNSVIYTARFPKMGTTIKKKRRLQLAELYGAVCFYCAVEIFENNAPDHFPSANDSTLEHVVPHSHGGTNLLNNLVLACYSCNQRRTTDNFEEFVMECWAGLEGFRLEVAAENYRKFATIKQTLETLKHWK